jgi:hypothetical protein
MTIKTVFAGALVAAMFAPAMASAAFVLDTGTPTSGSVLGSLLDANDFSAAEFNLSAGSTVTGIQAYVSNAEGLDSAGDTFTLAIYSASGSSPSTAFIAGRNATPLFSTQATYGADGWNGVSNLSWTATTTGQYWAAVEVNPSLGDSVQGLILPTPAAGSGTVPALAFAFNDGSGTGYQSTSQAVGLEVTAVAPVPLPAAAWLLGSGLAGLGFLRRRRGGVLVDNTAGAV